MPDPWRLPSTALPPFASILPPEASQWNPYGAALDHSSVEGGRCVDSLPSQSTSDANGETVRRRSCAVRGLPCLLPQEFVREGHHFEAASVLLGLSILPDVFLELPFDLDAIAAAHGLGERLAGLPVEDDRNAGRLFLPLVAAVVLVGHVQRGARDRIGLCDAQHRLHAHAAFELHVVPIVPGLGAGGWGWGCGVVVHERPPTNDSNGVGE